MSQPHALVAARDDVGGEQKSRSRQVILAAAAELFAERGFDQVTIRDIAARANLSPAMVMKCGGSKRDLFLEAATLTPPPLPDAPLTELGAALVHELIDRYERDTIEPLTRALVLRLSAPEPDAVRERYIAGYVEPLVDRLGGDDSARIRAELIVSTLSGLAASLRVFRLPTTRAALDVVAHRYGQLIQTLIDS